MRDATIAAMNATNAHNVATLYKHVLRLDARRQAYEKVFSKRWNVFLMLVAPGVIARLVDGHTQALLISHDKQMAEVEAKAKQEALRPKLTIVGANGAARG